MIYLIVFKILFKTIGMVYEEDEVVIHMEEDGWELEYIPIYARRKSQSKMEGWGDAILVGKAQENAFLRRWEFFKAVKKAQKNKQP